MASNMTPEQKNLIELILDALATAIIAYMVWTIGFQMKPIDGIHAMIAVLGTGAIGWLAWKQLRRNKALT